ncbi:TolC family outer membrane protein [Luteimonas sp. MC1825]|uniref:TolC family outer membrane protein n=1 Tax=Luteimonas sp. MC1825 TaxID=2761107 RepID=UPI00161E0E43|nr:TolC family outer membrane protein [Luteimonas sp. MC1825]MBB6600142.1 TolC family outer membrane protein [Luteimonas sp. MC1825]QOC87834.1 TolC family outer membrane protein [Luteimonas sp. MC1825]
MTRRPLVLALLLALLPAAASAEDLLQAYEQARNSDPTFSAAESSRLATREGAVQARASLLPQIGGSASLSRSRTETSGRDIDELTGQSFVGRSESEVTSRSLGVNLNQAVLDLGRISNLRSQRELATAADFTLDSAGDSLITRTSAAYFNVLVAIETLAAAQAQEAALKKQFDFADKRLEVGLAPITDVHEARAQYDSARANTIVTGNALEDAYQALRQITGTDVRNLKGLPEDFRPALPTEQAVDGWVSSAVENNPGLKALEHQLQAAGHDVGTAKAGHLPTIYLSGSYGDTDRWGDPTALPGGAIARLDAESKSRSVGLTLDVPIFAGGATQSRVRQAIATRDVRQDQYEAERRALVRETRNAYQTLVAGISEVEARKAAVFSARSAYDASQVGLEVGTRTVLDVLNNQQTLFNAEREYALARYNFLQNRLLLEQAAGTIDIASVQDVNRLLTVDAETRLQAPGTNGR